jgi:hypothetical protein
MSITTILLYHVADDVNIPASKKSTKKNQLISVIYDPIEIE